MESNPRPHCSRSSYNKERFNPSDSKPALPAGSQKLSRPFGMRTYESYCLFKEEISPLMWLGNANLIRRFMPPLYRGQGAAPRDSPERAQGAPSAFCRCPAPPQLTKHHSTAAEV